MANFQRPFLKWAGNKFQILEEVFSHFPQHADRLIEPFVGSGSVFLNALALGKVQGAYVGDSNPDIVRLYSLLRADASFIEQTELALFHARLGDTVLLYNDKDNYYPLRQEFNDLQGKLDLVSVKRRAQLFVYLNRHCFNGLCRYNSKGGYNVPMGSYKTIMFPGSEMKAFHQLSQSVTFEEGDFLDIIQHAAPTADDVVYFDPPYLPLTPTANFSAYSSDGGFGLDKQVAMAKCANELAARGVTVIVSNHDTAQSQALYQGAVIHQLQVKRFISGSGKRDNASELIAVFTPNNYNRHFTMTPEQLALIMP